MLTGPAVDHDLLQLGLIVPKRVIFGQVKSDLRKSASNVQSEDFALGELARQFKVFKHFLLILFTKGISSD